MLAEIQLETLTLHEQLIIILQCGIAAVCGGVVGLEREIAGKRAGIRTHMLVACSSALAVAIGAAVLGESQGDATRVLHAVVTGVGFIGAGAIVQSKKGGGPSGLTTATTVLLVAVLGAACGLGAPLVAAAVTLLAMATLRGVKGLELALKRRRSGSHGDAHDDDPD